MATQQHRSKYDVSMKTLYKLIDDDSGYRCSRRRCRRLRRLLIIIATAAAAVAAINKSSSSSSCIVLPENTNKYGATADGNNVSDVIMAWRGRGTHRLYNVVVTTGCIVEDSLLKRKCKFMSKLVSSKNLLIGLYLLLLTMLQENSLCFGGDDDCNGLCLS